jgi:NAD(P)-dependent dehydrogenase (short-subunit alcohol dehydrogenase family)
MTAVVIGATGGIGAALANALANAGHEIIRIGRRTDPRLDVLDEASIAAASAACGTDLRLVIDATGFLHDSDFQPEKSLRQIDPAHMARSFAINATGPALLMKHFLPLLSRTERAVFATLSARVGSITDNHLGGWYAYRASKAALNQLVRTAAIELARTRPKAICVSLHPGTVDTGLSGRFVKAGLEIQSADQSAAKLVAVMEGLTPEQTGLLFDHMGKPIPF